MTSTNTIEVVPQTSLNHSPMTLASRIRDSLTDSMVLWSLAGGVFIAGLIFVIFG